MSRRVGALLATLVVVVAVAGLALLGRPSGSAPSSSVRPGVAAGPARIADRPPGGDAALIAAVPTVRLAETIAASSAYDSAGGAQLRDRDGSPLSIEPGSALAVFEGPRGASGEAWFKVYVLPNTTWGPTDYVAWLPLHRAGGEDNIRFKDAPVCPDGRGVSVLGALDPFTRAGCLGAGSFAAHGWSWDRVLPTWYRITPAWFGDQNGEVDSTISLHEDARHASNPGPGPVPFLEVQLPAGLERPPPQFAIDVTVHAGDPMSRTCQRGQGEFAMVPQDAPENGPLWCATRLVLEQWTPVLGPEGRSIDPAQPQLHRHPDRGEGGACAGVGMPPLVFRMDPRELDPIWLQAEGFPESRIIPDFDPGFRPAFAPDLVIVDERGQVIARNGTPVDPDGRLAGHFICPTGRVVYFD